MPAAPADSPDGLNHRQRRFVEEYLIDLNATQAAIRAGYVFGKATAKFYTYFLADPATGRIFYVGKGTGKRLSTHAKKSRAGRIENAEKHRWISAIHDAEYEVSELTFSSHCDESDAYGAERYLIHQLRETGIANIANGIMSNTQLLAEQSKWMLSHVKPLDQWLAEMSPEILAQSAEGLGSPEAFYHRFMEEAASLLSWRREVTYYRYSAVHG